MASRSPSACGANSGPADEVRRLLRDLALALDSAHRDGVIHRDLKAENILIERGTGRAMLTDFGVALYARSIRCGRRCRGCSARRTTCRRSRPWASRARRPERSLFARCARVLHAVGGVPFDAPTFEALAAKHLGESHAPLRALAPNAPAALADAIERALAKERDLRWRDGREMADALTSPSRVAPVVRRRAFARRGVVSKSSRRRVGLAWNGAENRYTVDADLIRVAC